MIRHTLLAAALLAGSGSALAASSFNPAVEGLAGTNFRFGYVVDGQFTVFAGPVETGCLGSADTQCLRAPEIDAFLGAYTRSDDGVNNTAFLFADDVTLHPGPGAQAAAVAFVAPTAGTFSFQGFFRAVDAPFGQGVTLATPDGTGLLAPGATSAFSFTRTLGAGEFALFAVGNNGDYAYDTTGLNLSVAAVPEPATWAMMLGGFGLAGASVRRRARVRFAAA